MLDKHATECALMSVGVSAEAAAIAREAQMRSEASEAVSYTHLDVYKRQDEGRSAD